MSPRLRNRRPSKFNDLMLGYLRAFPVRHMRLPNKHPSTLWSPTITVDRDWAILPSLDMALLRIATIYKVKARVLPEERSMTAIVNYNWVRLSSKEPVVLDNGRDPRRRDYERLVRRHRWSRNGVHYAWCTRIRRNGVGRTVGH